MVSKASHSRFYFFIFACLGLISPYLGFWLNSVLPAEDLKYALMVFNATLIVVPTVWGYWAFKENRPGNWLSYGTIMACLFALGLTQVSRNITLLASCFLIVAFGVFFNPILPLLEAITYQQLKTPQSYSQVRLFGSAGFMFCSFLIGSMWILNNPHHFPYIVAALLFLCWCLSFPYKNTPVLYNNSIEVKEPIIVSNPVKEKTLFSSLLSLSSLWIVVILVQAAFACYYAFFALHMEQVVSSGWIIGALLATATGAEIFAFWKIDWFFNRWKPITLLATASLCLLLRWLLLAFITPQLIPLLFVFQLSQAIGFSVFHTVCLKIIHEKLSFTHVGAGQGFYNAIGYGVGGTIGVFFAGMFWEMYKGSGVFLFAFLLSVLSFVFALFLRLFNKK